MDAENMENPADSEQVNPLNENKSALFFFIGTGIGIFILILAVIIFFLLKGDSNQEEAEEDLEAQEEVEEVLEDDESGPIVKEKDEVVFIPAEDEEQEEDEEDENEEEAAEYEPYISKKQIESLVDDMSEIYWVTAIIDGDTLIVADQNDYEFQIRVLGVDTNEINGKDSTAECYAYEATQFTTELLKNRAVRLRADENNRDEDDFGRKLRFVDALQEDGSFISLSVALLSGGYAVYPDEYPLTTPEYYEYLEQEARDQEKGLWGACY